jgi:hypothetical protein
MTDDRAKQQLIDDLLSDLGGGSPSPSVAKHGGPPVAADGKSGPAPRTRNLRPTFRPVPGQSSTGFPGTRAFQTRGPHRGPNGPDIQPESLWAGFPPASSARSDDSPRRRVAFQQAGRPASPLGPAQPAAESAAGGNIRRRDGAAVRTTATGRPRGRPPGSKTKAVGAEAPIKRKPGRPPADKPLPLPKAIAKLLPKDEAPAHGPSKLVPTETERSDARRLFREIGETFNLNRKKSKTAAYAAFRHDLMANLDTLIMGGAIDLKEATAIITNLEQYTKETEAESTETPATILGKWLRMDAAEVAGLEVPEVVELVANDPLDEEEEPEESEAVDLVE